MAGAAEEATMHQFRDLMQLLQANQTANQELQRNQTAQVTQVVQGMAALLERMARRENASQNEAANMERPKPQYYEKLGGKLFEKMRKFTGGEEEWIEWSDEFRMIIDMQSPKLCQPHETRGDPR